MSFQQKYLKYKSKYLLLKNQVGGNLEEIFRILVSRKDPSKQYDTNPNNSIDAGYLESYDDVTKNWGVLNNQVFIDWCNSLVGGDTMNEGLVTETCNQLWSLFLAHFKELASLDTMVQMPYEKNNTFKLLRRLKNYFPNNIRDFNSSTSDIKNNDLKDFFCEQLTTAVRDTIARKKDEVPTVSLHYLFYSIFRGF